METTKWFGKYNQSSNPPRLLLLRDIDQLGGSAASVECSGRQLLILTNIPMSREHLAHAAFYSHFQLSPDHRQNINFIIWWESEDSGYYVDPFSSVPTELHP